MQPARPDKRLKLLRSRWWILLIVLLASLLLSGCVQSDLEINFRGQSGGQIVQHVKLADQLTTVSDTATQDWLDGIKRRARQLRGKTKQLSSREIEVVIPFGSPTDLETKLNQFLNPATAKPSNGKAAEKASSSELQLPLTQSHLKMTQQNFLFFLRNRLIYDIDLRSLGVQSMGGDLLLSPDWLELEFELNTPWGARSINAAQNSEATSPEVHIQGQQLAWTLQPGQLNHLEAVFWFPSPIGIGAVAITLLVAGGIYLKYGSLTKSSA